MTYYLTFGTKSGYFGPSDNVFRGQNADFGTIGGPTRLLEGHKVPYRGKVDPLWTPPDPPKLP